MRKYGQTALKAVQKYRSKELEDIVEAWSRASSEVFESESSRNKGCPRNAFFGLCEEGLVKGIPSGNYTRSSKNKAYAIKALDILKHSEQEYDPKGLWDKVDEGKVHNQQMDVVLTLWENNLIKIDKNFS